MKFEVISAEDLNKKKPTIAEGLADFEVVAASEKISNKGDPYISMQLKCVDKNGKEGTVFTMLMGTSAWSWKIRRFCECVGQAEMYETGNIDSFFCVGKTGQCNLKLDKPNNKGEIYMGVADYISVKDKKYEPKPVEHAMSNDDIPF